MLCLGDTSFLGGDYSILICQNNRPIRHLNYLRKFLLFCHRVVLIYHDPVLFRFRPSFLILQWRKRKKRNCPFTTKEKKEKLRLYDEREKREILLKTTKEKKAKFVFISKYTHFQLSKARQK